MVNRPLATASFERALVEVSEQTGTPVSQLREEASADLKEMASRPGTLTVAFWDRFCRWLSRAYEVDSDAKQIEQLRALNKQSALVFLPNHRSYLDPLILRSALQQHGFAPNNVLGGSNLAMWPLSAVGKRNGIVFIRREFRDDHLYRAVLKAYLSYLIGNHQNLEWYIEGGRTRTGKLRPPRYGILSYVIDAYADHPDNDVQIVPTSIIYDQQHEVGAISEEQMGGSKSPESIGWLYDFAKSQSRELGRAHVRFGEPLSLQDAVSLTVDEEGEPRPRLAVQKVAFEVGHRINATTPVTPSALVTFALLDNGDRAITADEGKRIVQPLLEYIVRRRLPMISDVDLGRHGALRDALDRLVTEGVVTRYDGGAERVFYVELEHQHEAAFYRNTIIHFFINRAITELAILQAAQDDSADIKSDTWRNARRLKDLLRFEFSFPTTREFAAEIAAETTIVHEGWEDDTFSAASATEALLGVRLQLAHVVIGPFMEAYSVLADELSAMEPSESVDESELVERSLGIAHQRWLQRSLHTAESVSRDYFSNAVKLAASRGLIESDEPDAADLADRRNAFAAELQDHVRRVNELRRIAQAPTTSEGDTRG